VTEQSGPDEFPEPDGYEPGTRPPRPADPDLDATRRIPTSTVGGTLFLVVLGVAVAGIVVVNAGNWRLGIEMLGGALIGASMLRLTLPQKDAGMLAVRNRTFDTSLLLVIGVILVFLAATIPDPA
jgi:hypothetical protein